MEPGFPVGAETNGPGTATTPGYAVAAGDVVLAFVGSDAAAGAAGFSIANRTISGGTLSWTRVGSIANSANGAVAVYSGTPSAALTGVTTTVTETGGSQAYISVVAIAGASSTLGAVISGGGTNTPASVRLTTTSATSWIFAVGEDWNSTTSRTLSATTSAVRIDERSDPAANDYWVERATSAAAGGFSIGTSAPNSANWNMVAVEVVPSSTQGTVPPPSTQPAATPVSIEPSFPVSAETNGSGTATTPTYAVAAGDVVLAFVGSDAGAGAAGFRIANRSVSGGTLTWTRVGAIANSANGAVAVYRGTPSAALTGVTTTVTETGGSQAYISVVAIAGASSTVGALATGGGTNTPASVTLTATAAGSWVFAVGEDWNSTTSRTLSATTPVVRVNERSDRAANDYWVERATTAAAGTFTIGTSAPSSANWNMVAVEVVPSSIQGTIPPPSTQPAAAQPTITPGTSTSSSTVNASIGCPTSGTLPYRTTDGSTPTTSATQSATAVFSASGTLKAICAGNGYSASAVTSAAYTITSGSGTGTGTASPMTAAHRTSGVAPLAVFFDAVDTTNTGTASPFVWKTGIYQPADMEGALWSWDFGDPGAGTWNVSGTGKSKNTATGYTAAHVFETPGTYAVRLTQTDVAGTVRTYTQTITVSAFTGTTFYATGSGSGSTCSLASPCSFATAMTQALGTAGPVRVLLRRGDTFSAATYYAITKSDPGIIGAYADGTAGHTASDPRPIITFTLNDGSGNNLFSPRSPGNDWRIMDLEVRGVSSTGDDQGPVGPPVNVQGVNTLALRIKSSGFKVGLGWGDWTPIYATPHTGMFVVECEMPSSGNYGGYVGGRWLALLGNLATDSGTTHVMRVWQAHKAAISNNAFLRPGGQRHALKLHGPEINDGRPETRWVSITDNIFQASSTSQWTVSMGSQSSAAPSESDPVSHLQFERNTFGGSASLIADIETEASHAMVRNNVFDDTLGSDVQSIIWSQRNTGVPAPDDIRIYNNTIYKGSGSSQSNFLQTDATATNLRVRNNLYGGNTSGVTLFAGSGGTGWTQDHNLLTGSPGFTSTAAGDFSLQTGSPAANAGATLGEVREDFLRAARPVSGTYDIGAYESR